MDRDLCHLLQDPNSSAGDIEARFWQLVREHGRDSQIVTRCLEQVGRHRSTVALSLKSQLSRAA